MVNTNKYPITVDGYRLDNLCYNVSTYSGRRRMSSRRSRDIVISGRDGEAPSAYDDFDAGQLVLRMWARGSDEDGNGFDRQLFDENMDTLFRIFGRNDGLLDIRQTMDPLQTEERVNFAMNPKMDKSSGATVVRTNYSKNPAMESVSGTAAVRTNLITNPSMNANITGWSGPAGTGRAWVSYGTSGGWGLATFNSGTQFEVYSPTFAVTAGLNYAAQAAMQNVSGAVRGRLGFVWYTGTAGTGTPTLDYGPSTEGFQINAWNRIDHVDIAPAGTLSARLIISSDVSFIGGLQFYWDQAIVEQADFTSDYFDGSNVSSEYRYAYRWTGTVGSSTSEKFTQVVRDWSGLPDPNVRGMQDRPGSFVYGQNVLRAESFAVIAPLSTVTWMGGRPAASPGQTWSGRISVKADVGSIGIPLRLGLYSFNGTAHSPVTTKDVFLTGNWQEIVIENSVMPVGTTEVGWRAQNVDEWPVGTVVFFDAATVEQTGIPGPFFIGGMTNVVWTGTAHNSTSTELGGTVNNWAATRGTVIKTYGFPNNTPFVTTAVAKYTATDVSVAGGNYITGDNVLFSSDSRLGIDRDYTVSSYVNGPGRASVQLNIYQGVTLLWSDESTPIAVDNDWERVWKTFTVPSGLTGADRLRILVKFYGAAGQPTSGDIFYITGSMAEVSSELLFWFDGNYPGATWFGNYSKLLPRVRRVWGKVLDSVDTEMFAPDGANFAVAIKTPYVFWEDLDDLVWYSEAVGGVGTEVMSEVANLRGSTAHISDAVIIVNGPATNPIVRSPKTGAYAQLNATLSSGQAWRIDVGRYLSGTGPKTLDWDSVAWTDQMWRTYYTGSRNRILTLHPEGEDGKVFITLGNCDSARIRAGRKYH